MQQFLETILSITSEAEEIPKSYFRQGIEIDKKQDETPVTAADRATEEHIRNALAYHFPDHGIFGEEFGLSENNSDYQWVIDPIDGTRAFIQGGKDWSHALSVVENGRVIAAAVYLPVRDLMYTATLGGGARLNGAPMLC